MSHVFHILLFRIDSVELAIVDITSFNREESQTLDALVEKEYISFDASFDDKFERYKDQDKSHEFYQSFY